MINKISKTLALLAATGTLLGASQSAQAAFSWQNITGNNPPQYDVSQQLSLTLSGSGNDVTFTFKNNVGIQSSITDVYIDAPPPGTGDTWLQAGSMVIATSSGVSFSSPASPPNLPGWGGLNPQFIASVSADSTPPIVANGINASGEYLSLTFALLGGRTWQDVQNAINSGDFRVGVHIQGLANGGSDSYTVVPEPTTVIAGALLLLPFGLSTVRRLRKS